jgi:hypothetical protein
VAVLSARFTHRGLGQKRPPRRQQVPGFQGLRAGIRLALPRGVSARPQEADPDDEAVQHDILAYLAVNPSGSDTWEGIVEWWLMEREYQREARRVKRALTALVRQGWLQRTLGPDRRTHYRLASERVEEVRRRFGDRVEGED